MQGNLFTGMFELASQFPPSVNTEDDPTTLKPFESPSCYGVDSTKEGRLTTGSIITGTARKAPTKTVRGGTWQWIYNRLWQGSGSTLQWGAPFYDDVYFPHRLGKFALGDGVTILAVMPAFGSQLWILTAQGSYFITNARNMNEDNFEPSQYIQELYTSDATYAMTLNGQPVVSNAKGVFIYDGSKVVELTKAVRSSLGNFGASAITADYALSKIVGTSNFVIDAKNGKLFDYGTSGFRYTSPTMAQPRGYDPFTVNSLVLTYRLSTQSSGTIKWQSKSEDEDWFNEPDIEIIPDNRTKTRIEVPITTPNRSVHKFAIRLTSMPSNVEIRSIQVNVVGLAVESGSK